MNHLIHMVDYKQKPFSYPRSRKARIKNFIAIPFSSSQALSTLADETLVQASVLNAAFGEDIWLISLDWVAALRGLTAGETPIEIGIAHGDLSATEMSEALDSEVTDPDDIIQKERARRPVRRLGMFASGTQTDIVLHDGNVKRSKIMFSVGDTHTLDFWARNQSGATLTTGAIQEFHGTLFGRWQR